MSFAQREQQRKEGVWIAVAAAILGCATAAYLTAHDMHNVYGDGIAHLNIARRIVDARDAGLWERYVQLGSPWLPLPHAAMLPFVWIDRLWRSGWAGTIPSLVAYVASVWLVFRIALDLYAERSAALVAAGALALNPSVLYMASTPMTELPFVAVLLATTYTLVAWSRDGATSRSALAAAALLAAATTLTRYEGWSLVPAGAAIVAIRSDRTSRGRALDAALWAALSAMGPLYWLWHNWAIYGDAIEFLRGPYSARAIFASQASRLGWASFVVGNPFAALGWGLLTVAVAAGPVALALAVVGLGALVVSRRRGLAMLLPALLPLVPFCFLVFSIFRGEAQIYPLAALALLNVRYGVPYVAAVALLLPAVTARRRVGLAAALAAAVGAQYVVLLAEGPSQLAVYQEAYRNSRNASQWRDRSRVAEWLGANPAEGLVLMTAGDLGPVVLESALEFRDVVHEGTREWNEWLATGEIPDGVTTVVMKEGDPAWIRLRGDPGFATRYHRVFATTGAPSIEVWRLNQVV